MSRSSDAGTQAFKVGCGLFRPDGAAGCAGVMVALTLVPVVLFIALAMIGAAGGGR